MPLPEERPDRIDIALAIPLRDGKLFVARRAGGLHLAGSWEFPGGKVEEGEPLEQALARELDEELGMQGARSRPFMTVRHRYPDLRVTLHFREVTAYTGEPHGREGRRLGELAQEVEEQRHGRARRGCDRRAA